MTKTTFLPWCGGVNFLILILALVFFNAVATLLCPYLARPQTRKGNPDGHTVSLCLLHHLLNPVLNIAKSFKPIMLFHNRLVILNVNMEGNGTNGKFFTFLLLCMKNFVLNMKIIAYISEQRS